MPPRTRLRRRRPSPEGEIAYSTKDSERESGPDHARCPDPLKAYGGDDHHREHERRADGPKEPEVAEELAGRPESVAAEPAEELLGAVRRHEEPDHRTRKQEGEIEKRGAAEILGLHGIPLVERKALNPTGGDGSGRHRTRV